MYWFSIFVWWIAAVAPGAFSLSVQPVQDSTGPSIVTATATELLNNNSSYNFTDPSHVFNDTAQDEMIGLILEEILGNVTDLDNSNSTSLHTTPLPVPVPVPTILPQPILKVEPELKPGYVPHGALITPKTTDEESTTFASAEGGDGQIQISDAKDGSDMSGGGPPSGKNDDDENNTVTILNKSHKKGNHIIIVNDGYPGKVVIVNGHTLKENK